MGRDLGSEDIDPEDGLAGERTDLAWNRTGIAVLICIELLLRRLWPLEGANDFGILLLIAVGFCAWALALVSARRISRTTHHGRQVMDGSTLKWLSVGTFAIAIAGLCLAMLPV